MTESFYTWLLVGEVVFVPLVTGLVFWHRNTTKRFLESIQDVKDDVDDVKRVVWRELRQNGGESMRDRLVRVETILDRPGCHGCSAERKENT